MKFAVKKGDKAPLVQCEARSAVLGLQGETFLGGEVGIILNADNSNAMIPFDWLLHKDKTTNTKLC